MIIFFSETEEFGKALVRLFLIKLLDLKNGPNNKSIYPEKIEDNFNPNSLYKKNRKIIPKY